MRSEPFGGLFQVLDAVVGSLAFFLQHRDPLCKIVVGPDFPGQFLQLGVGDGLAFAVGDQDANQGHHPRQGGRDDAFQRHHPLSGPVVEAALVRPDIHMNKGIVDAQAAVFAQQLVRVGVDLGGGVALYLDVRRRPVAVLALSKQ